MQGLTSRGAQYAPPPPDGDFYKISELLLSDRDSALIDRVRAFMQLERRP